MMEDMFDDMPSCLALGESGDSVSLGDSEDDQLISSWLMEDGNAAVCDLLSAGDAPLLDLQSVPCAGESPEYYCFGSQYSSPESPPSYTSTPDLPEVEGTIITVDTPPLFGEQVDDAILFNNSFTVNPDVLPELEKILASVDYISSPESSAPQSPASPSEASEKRAPKKRKGDDGKEIKGSDILLPRDQLLVMTSAEIETYVAGLKSQRNLTSAEEKDLKRQRRLVKNREYASQSRSRKKQFVDELENTIATLRSENTSLKQQVGTLSEENKTLKKKISSIATTIKKSSSLSTSTSGMFTRMTSIRPNPSKTAVGACLMAMMFMVISVGMLGDNQYKFQIYPISQHGDAYTYVGNGRVLHEVDLDTIPASYATTPADTPTTYEDPTVTTRTEDPTITPTAAEEPTTATEDPIVIVATEDPIATSTTTLVFASVTTQPEKRAISSYSLGDKEVENLTICATTTTKDSERASYPVLSYYWGAVKYSTINFTYKAPIETLPLCTGASAVYVS